MEILDAGDSGAVSRTIQVLRNGGVCAVPTDTVYGLIADATNEKAVRKIFDIKGRPKEKTVSLFVRDIKMAKEYAEVLPRQEKFLRHVWPGKVTVILGQRTKNKGLMDIKSLSRFVIQDGTIGMRAPKDEFLRKILKEMGAPLAQTSANVTGEVPAKNAKEIIRYFECMDVQPDLVIDGGACGGKPSTVLDLSVDGPKVLREGVVSREEIFRLLRESGLK